MSKLGKDKKMENKNYQEIVKGLDKSHDLFQSNFKKLRDLMVKDAKALADKKYNLSSKFTAWNNPTLKLIKSWNVSEKHFDTISRAYRSSTKLDKNGKLNKKGLALSGKSISNLGLTEEAKKSDWKEPEKKATNPKKKKELTNDEKISLIGILYSELTNDKLRPTEDRLEFLADKHDGYMISIQDIPLRKTAIPGK